MVILKRNLLRPSILQLPDDLVRLIAQSLSYRDYFRMASVCKSWRRLLADMCPSPQIPWLLLPNIEEKKLLSFYSMSDNGSVINVKLPDSLAGCGDVLGCCGSSKGWLVIATEKPRELPSLFLLAPLSGLTIALPSVYTLPFVHWVLNEPPNADKYALFNFIERVEVSDSINKDIDDLVVAALFFTGDDPVNQAYVACTHSSRPAFYASDHK